MIEVKISTDDLEKLDKDFADMPRKVRRQVNDVTRETTEYAWALTQRFASTPPGPQVRSGNYRASIKRTYGSRRASGWFSINQLVGTVYTDAPQSQRLENGFFGRDALGRFYSQPAKPHFRPAAALAGDYFLRRCAEQEILPSAKR